MHNDDARDPAWADVRSRSELSGEAKLTWWFIWQRARRKPGDVWLSYAELLVDQGRRDTRSPRSWLEQLRLKRFVELLEHGDGRARVFIKQPQDVLRPVESRGFTDGPQQQLPFRQRDDAAAAEAPSADGAQHPPADSAQHPPASFPLRVSAHPPLPLPSNLRNEGKAQIHHSTAADSAQHPPAEQGPQPIGATFEASIERLLTRNPGHDVADVEQLAQHIWARVDDDRLSRAIVYHVARAVVNGSFPAHELEAGFAWLSQVHRAEPTKKRWTLFVGFCRNAFARVRQPWPFQTTRRHRRSATSSPDVDAEATREAH